MYSNAGKSGGRHDVPPLPEILRVKHTADDARSGGGKYGGAKSASSAPTVSGRGSKSGGVSSSDDYLLPPASVSDHHYPFSGGAAAARRSHLSPVAPVTSGRKPGKRRAGPGAQPTGGVSGGGGPRHSRSGGNGNGSGNGARPHAGRKSNGGAAPDGGDRGDGSDARGADRKSKMDQPPAAVEARLLAMHHKRVLADDNRSPESGNFRPTMKELTEVEALRCRSDDAIDDYGSQLRALMQSWRLLTAPDKADALAAALLAAYTAAAPADAPVEAIKDQDWAATAFVGMIGKAVAAHCSPGGLLELTAEMGGRHALYGVGEAHYKALRTAFFQVLQERLPADLHAQTLKAWEALWELLVRMLVSEATNERGKYYAAQKHAQWVATVTKVLTVVAERQAAPAGSERRHMFCVHLYDRGVAKDPKMKRYFLLREARNADRAMDAVIKIVTNLNDMPAVDAFLEELGIRHIDYDMTEATLRAYRQPFLDTCEQYVGEDPDLWNEDSIEALGALWDYVRAKWALGFNVNKKSMASACAPDGANDFCIIFTDIEASTKLWAKDREVMRDAVKNHHRIIRSLISDFGGYEVKTIGDSFMIACKDVLIALKISVAIQLELMRGPIWEGFEMVENTQGFGDESAWRKDSVRVRVGMHYCESAGVVYDSVQRRYDYYGPSVNCASRVESVACGGQILMSEETYLKIMENEEFKTKPHDRFLTGINITMDRNSKEHLKPLSDYLTFTDLGWKDLKGIPNPVKLISVAHQDLLGRQFPMPNELPSSVSTTFAAPKLGVSNSGGVSDELDSGLLREDDSDA